MSVYVYTRQVQFAETDMAGIVHFTNFFRYMEEAEHAYLRSLGLSVMMHLPDGRHIGWPRVRCQCTFEAPVTFEQTLEVRVKVLRKGVKSLTFEMEFWWENTRLAVGMLKTCCCEITPGLPLKSIEIPQEFADKIIESPAPRHRPTREDD